ncbi:hypothetical protein [Flexivirga alba]|uniref:hypothetical protein n=1 Tax=Flexivirga alba TaxID=702742 RepID=UPI0036D42C23
MSTFTHVTHAGSAGGAGKAATGSPGHDCCGGGCELPPFTRNAYWYGKLLVPQDFIDEQSYVREKIRHHNQRLHGTGWCAGCRCTRTMPPRAATGSSWSSRAARSTAAATRSWSPNGPGSSWPS